MINIILCGGNGTRLWPISRNLMPKQFVKLFDDRSLFQLTVERNARICDKLCVVSNVEQYFLAVDQLEELSKENSHYLLEPVGRNTAPAIALSCLAMDFNDIVLVTPSDHLIKNDLAYRKAVSRAKELALENNLVTFGIKPTFAEIGFGYIETESLSSESVTAFHEKPDLNTAISYIEAGNYFWNSGMFVFKAGVFLDELKTHSPAIYDASVKAFKRSKQDGDQTRISRDDMINIPEDSIDYAVMEKSQYVKVVPAEIDWNDIGSFDALYNELPKDENGNTKNSNHISIDSSNNLIWGNERKIATVDIDNSIIVDTGDALLVSKQGSSQKVKQVVEKLRASSSHLPNKHLTTYRPWGTYTLLEHATDYKVKRIEVKPGCQLSMQKHHHRNEHWIVLSGVATVSVAGEIKHIYPNESTYIRMGEPHQLSNFGKTPVVLIETQVGEYIDEDDTITLGKTSKNIFRECDIRGIYPQELNEQTVKKLGYYFACQVKKRNKNSKYIAVGFDARLHSPQISKWLTCGISHAGLCVLELGMVPTPLNYFANFVTLDGVEASASIMVTGSHNPPQYNGFKMTLNRASFFGNDIYALGDEIISSDIIIPNVNHSIEVDIKKHYIDYMLKEFAHLNLHNKSFVFDCGNGVADTVLSDVLSGLNIKHKILFAQPDGNFPNHHPDPSDIENLRDLQAELATGEYDLGFAYDGDADRIAVLSQKYNFKGDVLGTFFARFIENPIVVGEVKCSQIMYDEINARGTAIMYKTGHSNLKQKIREIEASFATEVSGHLYFNDRYFGIDDAIYATLRTLELISKGFDFNKEYEALPLVCTTEEIHIATTEDKKFSIINDINKALVDPPTDFPVIRDIIRVDGLRVVFEHGWGLVRASNTTPKLVMRFEAMNKEYLKIYQSKMIKLVEENV